MTATSIRKRHHAGFEFVERALIDFGLLDAFLARPDAERAGCVRWLDEATDSLDEEERVSRLLDCLDAGEDLPRLA